MVTSSKVGDFRPSPDGIKAPPTHPLPVLMQQHKN